tara:strand:+ start:106 stop:408 length:303 start_codon:yes stop_codon:yes gene_type:complete
MATKIVIRHKDSGLGKDGYYGFSWTYFFFGWLVPLIRGELAVAALHLLFTIFTLGIWQLIACFIYNRQFMERKLTEGWQLTGSDQEVLAAKGALGLAIAD